MIQEFKTKRPITSRRLYLRPIDDHNHLDEIEKKFYSSIQLPNGTYKETNPHRLDDVNDVIIKHFKNTNGTCSRILDVGISSGISTLELHEIMEKNSFHVQITAVDLLIHAYITRLFYGIYALLDGQANILQIDLCGYGIGHWYKNPKNFKDMLKLNFDRFYAFFMKKGIEAKIRKYDKDSKKLIKVKLLSHRLLKNHDIGLFEYDILNSLPEEHRHAYDYIRVANILNLLYFSENDILSAVKNLKDCLRGRNSVLCIVRTDFNGSNHGSVYSLDSREKLQKVLSINNGSEIDDYINKI